MESETRLATFSAAGKRAFRHLTATLFVVLVAAHLEAPASASVFAVSGRIYDAVTLQPLAGVQVRWKNAAVVSDSSGFYIIRLAPGTREISYQIQGRPAVRKIAGAQNSENIRLDVLLPSKEDPVHSNHIVLQHPVLIRKLQSDFPGEANVTVSDELGNDQRFLLMNTIAQCPVWADNQNVVFGVDGVVHRKDLQSLGVYRQDIQTGKQTAVATGAGIRFVDVSKGSVVAASYRELFVVESSRLKKIFDAVKGSILSVAWGSDNRIYFTINDEIPVDATHSNTKSRIASMNPDGTELTGEWAADKTYSYRYPAISETRFFFSRFSLDGREQSIWKKNTGAADSTMVLDQALRFVGYTAQHARLYYLYKNDLHLKDFKSGLDMILIHSVLHANILR